jgi:hypothetical protein
MVSHCMLFPIPHYIFKGSLVDPRLRASYEGLPISLYLSYKGSGEAALLPFTARIERYTYSLQAYSLCL